MLNIDKENVINEIGKVLNRKMINYPPEEEKERMAIISRFIDEINADNFVELEICTFINRHNKIKKYTYMMDYQEDLIERSDEMDFKLENETLIAESFADIILERYKICAIIISSSGNYYKEVFMSPIK